MSRTQVIKNAYVNVKYKTIDGPNKPTLDKSSLIKEIPQIYRLTILLCDQADHLDSCFTLKNISNWIVQTLFTHSKPDFRKQTNSKELQVRAAVLEESRRKYSEIKSKLAQIVSRLDCSYPLPLSGDYCLKYFKRIIAKLP